MTTKGLTKAEQNLLTKLRGWTPTDEAQRRRAENLRQSKKRKGIGG